MSSLGSISASANASCEGNSVDPFESLPDEVIAKIFNRCALSKIVELMVVSRRFHRIVKSLPIWRLLFERAWMGPYPTRLDSQRGAAHQYFCQLQLLINRGQLGKIISTTSLAQHTSPALCLVVTPDWKIISGSVDGTIRILDVIGKQLACFSGHEGRVRSIAVTPDGTKIISGSADGTIRIWNSENGEQIACLIVRTGRVRSVAVTPDGTKIILTSEENTIKILEVTGQEIAYLKGYTGRVCSVAVTPDGTKIISGSNDSTIRILDSETRAQIACFSGHEGKVRSLAVTPDGTKIISGSDDCTIRILDITGQEIACLRGHEGWVKSVIVTPDGTKIISASSDSTIRIWDSETGKQIACLRGHTSWVNSIALTPDGKILSASSDHTIRVHAYDPEAFEQLCFQNLGVN